MDLAGLVGKNIKVAFNDGQGIVARQGVLSSFKDGFLTIEQRKPYPVLLIAAAAIVRIEVVG